MPSNPAPKKGDKRSAAEALARARAAAAPRLEKAAADAGPKVEKAAQAAGTLLGTLRDRARETVKQFSDGYGNPEDDVQSAPDAANSADSAKPADRPRPRPRPGPHTD